MRERLHFHFSLSSLEKEMATHSSVLAWRIPGTVEPGGLRSMGSAQSRHRLKRLSSSNSKGFCGASLVAQLVKNLPEMQETAVRFLGSRKIFWRRGRLPTQILLGFPGGSDGKESSFSAEDLGLIPELGRSPGGEHGNPLQYSCLENPSGQRSLVGHSPRGRKELDTTE